MTVSTDGTISVDQVSSGAIAGVETVNLFSQVGDLAGALAVIQNSIFQNK